MSVIFTSRSSWYLSRTDGSGHLGHITVIFDGNPHTSVGTRISGLFLGTADVGATPSEVLSTALQAPAFCSGHLKHLRVVLVIGEGRLGRLGLGHAGREVTRHLGLVQGAFEWGQLDAGDEGGVADLPVGGVEREVDPVRDQVVVVSVFVRPPAGHFEERNYEPGITITPFSADKVRQNSPM